MLSSTIFRFVPYSDTPFLIINGHLNSRQIICYSDNLSNNEPFYDWITFDFLNARLVQRKIRKEGMLNFSVCLFAFLEIQSRIS